MSNLSRMMRTLVGSEPYDKLCKAVRVDEGGYLASWVAARALLSWYRSFASSLGKSEAEYRALPGCDDALLYVEREGDSYMAQVVRNGEVAHEFRHDATSASQLPVARAILSENLVEADLAKGGDVPGPEALEKIGEIIDKLVKIESKKLDGDKQEVREDLDPEQIYRNNEEARLDDPSVETPGRDVAHFDAERVEQRLSGKQKKKPGKKQPGGDDSAQEVDPKGKKFKKDQLSPSTLADASLRQKMNFGGKKKPEPLSKPPVSEAQRRAMHAAASGHSTLGIPKSVGKEFSDADKPGKLPARIEKAKVDEGMHDATKRAVRAARHQAGVGGQKGVHSRATGIHTAVAAGKMPWRAPEEPAVTPEHRASARASAVREHHRTLRDLRSMPAPKLPKKEIEKAGEMPSGAGMPKGPKLPKPPVPAGNAPAAQATKQAQMSGAGKVPMPKPPAAPKAPPKPKLGAVSKSQGFVVSEEEIYTPCHHCGVPEFAKTEGGPKFKPCACFVSETEAVDGGKKKFVELTKGEDGKLRIQFAPDVDADAKKLFLLLVKGTILASKRFPNQEE